MDNPFKPAKKDPMLLPRQRTITIRITDSDTSSPFEWTFKRAAKEWVECKNEAILQAKKAVEAILGKLF